MGSALDRLYHFNVYTFSSMKLERVSRWSVLRATCEQGNVHYCF